MACVIQNSRQKAKLGKKAPWIARWKGVDGKVHSLKVAGTKADAKEIAHEKERNAQRQGASLILDVEWPDFRKEYEKMVLPTFPSVRSRESAEQALDMFEKLSAPCLVGGISTKDLKNFHSKRARQPGKKIGSKVAAATIKKELRTIRAALAYAHDWGYLPVIPKLPDVDGCESDKAFVTVEHFDAMMKHLDAATKPSDVGYEAKLWWDALLSLLWVAPNRIQAALSLRWEFVDLEAGTIFTPARSTKQKRDHKACIPAVVADKLRRIKRFLPVVVFPWSYSDSTLYRQFFAIQEAAGIKLTCTGDHKHTEHCHFYKFHDFRRSFATLNDELPESMQTNQMGHASYATTQKYKLFAKKQQSYADKIHLPPSMQMAVSVQ